MSISIKTKESMSFTEVEQLFDFNRDMNINSDRFEISTYQYLSLELGETYQIKMDFNGWEDEYEGEYVMNIPSWNGGNALLFRYGFIRKHDN